MASSYATTSLYDRSCGRYAIGYTPSIDTSQADEVNGES
jgi:hypothetical protein